MGKKKKIKSWQQSDRGEKVRGKLFQLKLIFSLLFFCLLVLSALNVVKKAAQIEF